MACSRKLKALFFRSFKNRLEEPLGPSWSGLRCGSLKLWKRRPLFCGMNHDQEEVSEAPPNSPEPQEASISVESPRGTYTVEKLSSSGGSVGAEDTSLGGIDLKEEEGLTHLSEGENISLPTEEAEVMESNLESSAEPQETSISVESPCGTYTVENLPSSGGCVGAEDTSQGCSDLKEEKGLTHLSEGENISLPTKEAEVLKSNLESSPEPRAAGLCEESRSGTYTVEKLPSSRGSVGVEDISSGLTNLREEEQVTKLSGEEDIRPPWEEVEMQTSDWERRQRASSLISSDEDALCSQDPEDDSLDGISSLEDENERAAISSPLATPCVPLPGPLDLEEEEEAALHPSRWPSCDPEKCEDLLHRLCQLLCSPPSIEAIQAVDYVAWKHLGLAIEHFLESTERQCAELIPFVFISPCCNLDAALDLLLAQVKGGPQQPSSPLDAATVKATRAIGWIITCFNDIRRLENVWLPELFPALVNLLFEVTRLEEEEETSGNPENNSFAIFLILGNLLKRMAEVSQEEISTVYRRLFFHEVPEVRRSALTFYGHFIQHLEHPQTEYHTIHDLLAVLMLVEDEDLEVAEAAKAALWEVAESLQWRLERSLLAEETFSLQEALHKVAKRLIQHCDSEELDSIVRRCGLFFVSSHPWVKKAAAMLFGHLVHKAGGSLSTSCLLACGIELSRLIVDWDPDVRRVARQTRDIVVKAFNIHHHPGRRAAFWRRLMSLRKRRYPPEYV